MPVTDTVCPLGAEKIYEIVDGNCIKATPIENFQKYENTKSDSTQIKLDLVTDNLTKIEEAYEGQTAELAIIHSVENDLLEDDLNDMFKESLRKFPNYIKRLQEYNETKTTKPKLIMEVLINKTTN